MTARSAAAVRTADLSDAEGDRLLPCSLPWRSFGAVTSFTGPAATIACLDDNGLVREALSRPGHGRVLVVDAQGSLRVALVGDMLADMAVRNGWTGLIVHGAVRDVVALARVKLGVFALGTNPRRGSRYGSGQHDVDVTFGGVTVHPGSRVFADEDGVLVETAHR